MQIIDLIELKKNKQELTHDQIDYLIKHYVIDEDIADYQMSALLMAFNLNGMSDNEILYLTQAFIKYSKKINFPHLDNQPIIDKHSSGGVGDKTTLILLPILVSLGINIPKISGRSLGHTGGTIDKLDSIKVKTDLSLDEAEKIFSKNKFVIFQQTKDYVCADKKIYALRDVTATVDTIGLIVASILSKKFIINSDYIFIDLKVGNGALMKDINSASILSEKMMYVASRMQKKLIITLTQMDEPLGFNVGNFLEIIEVIEFLSNKKMANDLKMLIYEMVHEILVVLNKTTSKQQTFSLIDNVINNQIAYKHFLNWLKDQQGDIEMVQNYEQITAPYKVKIVANDDGYLHILSAKKMGLIALKLGAGRLNKETKIDYLAGIQFLKKTNDKLSKNETIAILHSCKPINDDLINEFYDSIKINNQQLPLNNIIIKTLSNL